MPVHLLPHSNWTPQIGSVWKFALILNLKSATSEVSLATGDLGAVRFE